MMKYQFILLFSLVLFMGTSSFAQDQIKNDSTKFVIGFSERFRIETWDNAISLSSAANAGSSYNRNRTTLSGQWLPDRQWEVMLAMTDEFRPFFAPSNKLFTVNEVFFDQLYVKYNNSFGTITLGRQNIMVGEGFIVFDGSPLDGSRSAYFNAARIDINLAKTMKLSAFATYVPVTDNILPLINKQDQHLVEQPEDGGGLYIEGQFDKANIQTYYIFKHIESTNIIPIKSDIHTLGARFVESLDSQLSFTGEGAYQFGDYGSVNRAAYGGYAYFDYSTKFNQFYLPKVISAGTIILSGDNTNSAKIEGWDPVFSRWPKWSESYIYTLVKENKVAYWSNLASIYAKFKFVLMDKLNFNIDYHHMYAMQKTATTEFLSGTGKTRGDLLIAKLNFTVNNNISGHILCELFSPGNFYFNGANAYNWTRMELMYKF